MPSPPCEWEWDRQAYHFIKKCFPYSKENSTLPMCTHIDQQSYACSKLNPPPYSLLPHTDHIYTHTILMLCFSLLPTSYTLSFSLTVSAASGIMYTDKRPTHTKHAIIYEHKTEAHKIHPHTIITHTECGQKGAGRKAITGVSPCNLQVLE